MVGFVVQRGDRWCGFMKSVPKLISPPFGMLSGLSIPFISLLSSLPASLSPGSAVFAAMRPGSSTLVRNEEASLDSHDSNELVKEICPCFSLSFPV